ncbi:MAG: DNA mismatch repair protein MutS, partial [Firmicutes bacterium]|nr:DNA mismatch repair protein MutS [Bacillota bacterium]
TFYVEMSELAFILNTASDRSLVILDEIGRGTSTYDGLSIAWAVVEELTKPQRKIRTLFATHYHELTSLSGEIKGVKNLNVQVSEENGNIVFLHKIVPGSASRSYGIHVAKLAGVPKRVLDSAESKLHKLINQAATIDDDKQISMFKPQDSVIAERLRNLDLMNLTPSQAIKELEELKKYADD